MLQITEVCSLFRGCNHIEKIPLPEDQEFARVDRMVFYEAYLSLSKPESPTRLQRVARVPWSSAPT